VGDECAAEEEAAIDPQIRSPLDLLSYQLAQDCLFGEVLRGHYY